MSVPQDPTPNLIVELVDVITTEVVEAMAQLMPQLSTSAPAPTEVVLAEIVASPATLLFRLPSGLRAWIEDVVVDASARGAGVGERLNRVALDEAAARGARTVELTSRPSREAANRLYQRLGFVVRETNVYRFTHDD